MKELDEADEILGTNRKPYANKKDYSQYKTSRNNNWRNQQNRDRQAIYDTMDRMAIIVSGDSDKFKEYLDIQSRFYKYSVGNSLVLLEKAPNSTQIKDKKSWVEKGVALNENAKGIKILEPSVSNGITYYNPKVVFDISQTNSSLKETTTNYGDRVILKALLHNFNVPREAVDKLPNGEESGTQYDRANNVLYVCKGMNRETLFQTLSQEISNIELENDGNSGMDYFISYCTSYMICKKYGIDVSNYSFHQLPREITEQRDGKGIRSQLDRIRSNFERINSRMLDYLEISSKTRNKAVPER